MVALSASSSDATLLAAIAKKTGPRADSAAVCWCWAEVGLGPSSPAMAYASDHSTNSTLAFATGEQSMTWTIELSERGLVPEVLIRAGIRRLLTKSLLPRKRRTHLRAIALHNATAPGEAR